MSFKWMMEKLKERFIEIVDWDGERRVAHSNRCEEEFKESMMQGVDKLDAGIDWLATIMAECTAAYSVLATRNPELFPMLRDRETLLEYVENSVGGRTIQLYKEDANKLQMMMERMTEIANEGGDPPATTESIDARLTYCSILLIHLIRTAVIGKDMERKN